MKELRYSLRHDPCWLQESTLRFPGLTLVVSTVYESDDDIHVDMTAHGPDLATIQRAEESWRVDPRIKKIARLYEGPRGVRYHVRYVGTHSVYPFILQNTPISLGQISIAAGVEHYTVVGEAEDVQRLLAVMSEKGDVQVESVRNLSEMPHEVPREERVSLAEALTDKQLEAILVAYTGGYYQWPRTVSASKLATRLNRSSSAFLAHLRQAESKVLELAVQGLLSEDPGRLDAVHARLAEGPPEAAPQKGRERAAPTAP